MMGKYIYESHMGGLYTSDEPVPFEDLYCETCGDSDWELGFCDSRAEAEQRIRDCDMFTDYFIKKFLDENFPEDELVVV